MGFPERKQKILKLLDQHDNRDVQEIADALGISAITIRRDLQQLSEEGLLVRTHGGAMKAPALHSFTAFADKAGVGQERKQHIGKLAAAQVKPGDTIFLDCGSTVFAMCQHLRKTGPLRVITNSLPVVAALMDCDQVTVNLIGGEIDKERKAMHGQRALQHIDSYHAAKAFIGTDGLSLKNGLTAFSEKEASVSKAMAAQADTVYLLCDSGKIGKDSYLKYAPLTLFHHLITDRQLPATTAAQLNAKGVSVIS
ncbi:DeoR/GlpR transcriptional regulator [Chitinophaga varians]|uniref:DeoR/GlpR transcriptional regulator n=1 Tax=Chitinophaga varians TaxID=2202339 RepID=A0A847RUS0_9BACT|nr:DeoR/GlpR family DNA-binding transcription regulator [Chitinophaga varians]NLR66823.1 DeoR/GlpR transcriptional regulator [Chitinophaga varians]